MLATPLCGPRAPFASRLRVMGEGAVLPLLVPNSRHPVQARAAVLHPRPCPHTVHGLPGKHSHFRGFWKAWHIPSAESKGASQGHQAFASQPQTFGPIPGPPAPNSLPTHQMVPVIQNLCFPSTKTPLCCWTKKLGAGFPSLSPHRRVSELQGEAGLCALPGPPLSVGACRTQF